MTTPEATSDSHRRTVLKGLGLGAMGVPLVTGTAAAQASCSLRVSVEAGEGNADNWTPRSRLTDEFKSRIDISGHTGRHLALMVAVRTPNGELKHTHSTTFQPDWQSGFVVPGKVWNPNGVAGFGSWESGTYHFHATVSDSDGNVGGAVSEPFEVDPE